MVLFWRKDKGFLAVVITLSRNHVITFSVMTMLKTPRPVAFRIPRAAPELLAGIHPLLGHPPDHRLATLRADWRIGLDALFCAVGEPFGGQSFGEATFFTKGGEEVLDLFAKHHD